MALSKEQRWFLQALKEFIHGAGEPMPQLNHSELDEIWRLSGIHKVAPLVYDAVERLPGEDAWKIRWKERTRREVYHQAIRSQAFLELCKGFQSIRVLVVKGILCRSLYPKADYRSSSDEDCLVSPEDFPAAHEVLLSHGLRVTDPGEAELGSAQVVTYIHPQSGLRIELHRRLFDSGSEAYGEANGLFSQALSRAVPVSVDGVKVWSMCPTDHFLYLLLHAYKHFLHGGFGIRQVCDICVYARQYARQIDWAQAELALGSYQAEIFAAAILAIGREYLGFDTAGFLRASVPDTEDLLQDILAGGIYGGSTEDRRHSSLITLNAATGKSQKSSVIRTAFPGVNALKGRYSYLNSKPWLLPVAWGQRIFSYLGAGRQTSAKESIRIGAQRVELLKKYGMLKEE